MLAKRLPVLGVALLLLAVGARAQEIRDAPPTATSFKVGALNAWSLRDAEGAYANDGKTFGLGIDPAEVGRVLTAMGGPSDKVPLSVNVLLVAEPSRVMLFDAGIGPKLHGTLMKSLALTGVPADKVTDIFITHSHFDHVGGLVDASGALAFPNATIHMSAPEWTWMKGQASAAALVTAITPRVRTFEPSAVVAPDVTALPVAGHTRGHTAYVIASGRQSLTDIGDTAHSSIISVARPDWKVEFDADRDLAAQSRRDEIARLGTNGSRVFAPHFPYPGVGRIGKSADGYRWAPENPPR